MIDIRHFKGLAKTGREEQKMTFAAHQSCIEQQFYTKPRIENSRYVLYCTSYTDVHVHNVASRLVCFPQSRP